MYLDKSASFRDATLTWFHYRFCYYERSLLSHTELCELKPYVTSILEIWTQMNVSKPFFSFCFINGVPVFILGSFVHDTKPSHAAFSTLHLSLSSCWSSCLRWLRELLQRAPPEQEEELTSAEWGFYEVLIGGVAATHKSCHRNADLTFPGEAGHRAPTEELAGHLTSLESWPRTSVRRQPSSRQKGKGCAFKTAARKSISGQ